VGIASLPSPFVGLSDSVIPEVGYGRLLPHPCKPLRGMMRPGAGTTHGRRHTGDIAEPVRSQDRSARHGQDHAHFQARPVAMDANQSWKVHNTKRIRNQTRWLQHFEYRTTKTGYDFRPYGYNI